MARRWPLPLSVAGAMRCGFRLSIVLLAAASGCGGGGEAEGPAPGTLDAAGGTLQVGSVLIEARPGAVIGPVRFSVTDQDVPPGLPGGITAVGRAIDVDVDDPGAFNAPVRITARYDDSSVADEGSMMVVHLDPHRGYEPATVLAHDATSNTITFDTRTFSLFVIVKYAAAALSASYTVPEFDPDSNGWPIRNFGNHFAGGQCLGMSAFCIWFFGERLGESLQSAFPFSEVNEPPTSIAHLVASRAHLAQSQYWAGQDFAALQALGEAENGRRMKAALELFDQPLVLLLVNGEAIDRKHACVLYGFDATGFRFYEVNFLDVHRIGHVPFDGTSFGDYDGIYGIYNRFGFVGRPSLGRGEDFADLTLEAERGFRANDIVVTAPVEESFVNASQTQLQGTTPYPQMIAYVNGVERFISVGPGGSFDTTIPVADARITVVLMSGEFIEQQADWHKNAATRIISFRGPPVLGTYKWVNREGLGFPHNGILGGAFVFTPRGDGAYLMRSSRDYEEDGVVNTLVDEISPVRIGQHVPTPLNLPGGGYYGTGYYWVEACDEFDCVAVGALSDDGLIYVQDVGGMDERTEAWRVAPEGS